MGAMREAMLREMALRGFAARTQQAYVGWMRRLVSQTRVAADQLQETQVRAYLVQSPIRGIRGLVQHVVSAGAPTPRNCHRPADAPTETTLSVLRTNERSR